MSEGQGGGDRRWGWAVLAAGAALILWRASRWATTDLVMDDAFILYRYAQHLADGLGPVFNPGERVEGYVCFLWVALLALGRLLGLPFVEFSWALSFLASLGTVALLWVAGRRLAPEARPWQHALAPLAFAAMATPARYVVSGMETSLFVLVITWGTYLALTRARPFGIGAVFGLAGMIRPEAALYLAVAVGFELLAFRTEPPLNASPAWRQRLGRAVWLVAGCLAVYGPYFLWRWAYYGYFLPNPFYAKIGGGSGALLLRGLRLSWQALWGAGLPIPALLALAALLRPGWRRAVCLGLALVGVSAAYFILVGGDFFFLFGPRFLAPALPWALLCAVLGLLALTAKLAATRYGRRALWGRLIWVAAIALLALDALWLAWPPRFSQMQALAGLQRGWIEVGRWLAANTGPEDEVAVGAAGAIPFYSGRRTIDMLGLNDLHIGHRRMPLGKGAPGHEKYDTPYVLSREPEIVVFLRMDERGKPALVGDWAEVRERFGQEYELAALGLGVPNPKGLPWVIEAHEWSPEIAKKGYHVAVFRRRPAPS